MPAIRISTSRRRELVGKVWSSVFNSSPFTFATYYNCIVNVTIRLLVWWLGLGPRNITSPNLIFQYDLQHLRHCHILFPMIIIPVTFETLLLRPAMSCSVLPRPVLSCRFSVCWFPSITGLQTPSPLWVIMSESWVTTVIKMSRHRCATGWLTDWLTDSLTHSLTDSLSDWLNDWLTH